MDAVSPSKEKVTLVGYSPKLEDRTLRGQRSVNNGGITITVNGTTNPRNDESPTQPERVTLIGFSRSESFNTPHDARPMNFGPGFGSNSASEHERQERLNRLTERTREWFSKMRQENDAGWPGGDGAFLQNSERMRMFFEEAHAKFNECSNDRFDQFVHDNQERFTQMLEMHNLLRPFNTRGSFTPNGNVSNQHGFTKTKYSFCSAASAKGSSGIGSDMDNASPLTSRRAYSGSTTPNGPTGFPKFPTTYSGMSSDSSSNHNQSRNFSPPSSFLHSFDSNFNQNGDVFSKCRTEFGTNKPGFGGNSHFGSFPSFPTFPTFPTFASVPSSANTYVAKVNASRSTFEYCGNTDTYRFSTEEVRQEFGQSFDTVSESDDDEEDDEEETSTCGDPSEYGDESSAIDSANSDSGSLKAVEYDNKLEKINNTLHKIANELLTTERSYVHVLHLIDQVFYFRVDNENRAHNMFPQEVITQMFSNIKSIYKLHHDFLLPQLEQRMANWEQERRIGDIMKNFAPFLKMYTEYVKNFDNAMNTINCCASKVTRFANILEEIQKMPECGCLTMQHHMLVPIQRVPRYELLLKDYLKKLPEESPDRADTEKALHLVSTAANHSNDAMKKIDKFKKLLEIQDMIGGSMDLVSPTRELVKEGKIIKISNRSGDHQERHLFLFNDMLLLCSQRLIANRVVSGPCFKVRAKLDVDNLQILEGDNIETANTFYISNNQKTIELYTQTPEEKEDWMQALCKVVQDLYKRKSSLKIGAETLKVHDADLGRRPPTFLKMDTIGYCMNCSTQFTAFKRRHHCRACGAVVCNKCSSHKLPLVYDDNKANRVCNQCYETLKIQPPEKGNTEESEKENIESPIQRKGILEVKASDDCVLSSYLYLKTRGKTWIKRWFTLHKDFVLYSFKSSEDEQALTSMPVPGFTVSIPDKSDGIDKENVFKLFHKKKVYYFQAKDKEDLQRWLSSLEKASRAELPT